MTLNTENFKKSLVFSRKMNMGEKICKEDLLILRINKEKFLST